MLQIFDEVKDEEIDFMMKFSALACSVFPQPQEFQQKLFVIPDT